MKAQLPKRGSAHAGEDAWTLIEIAIVLVLVSALVAAAIPAAIRMRQELSLWTGTRLVESSLRWARAHAVAFNSAIMFAVEGDGRSFCLKEAGSGETIGTTMRHLGGGVRIVGMPRSPVRFYPSGHAAPAGTYRLQGEAGVYRVVVQLSGRVRIQRE